MDIVISALYFYFPVALANSAANIGRFIPFFRDIKQPVDFGLKYNGVRLIGDHKNIGSFCFGIIAGTSIAVIKYLYLDPIMQQYSVLELSFSTNIILYFFMSFFALLGDLIESAIKRLFKIRPHAPFIPFDEIDHSVLSMIFAKLFFPISWQLLLTVIISFFFLHILANLGAYMIGIKDVPY